SEGMQGVIGADGSLQTTVSVARHAWQRPFDASDVRELGLLVEHMQQAHAIGGHIRGLESSRRTLQGILDMVTVGVVLLDASSRILLANKVAAGILAGSDLVGSAGGRVVVRGAGPAGRLERIIGAAVNGDLRTASGLRLGEGAAPLTLF